MQPLFALETRKIHRMQWLAPLLMVAIVVLYEALPSAWMLDRVGRWQHIALDTAFFGITGPLLVFFLLKFIVHWLEERETSELQAAILEQSRVQVGKFRESADTALQSLFASSILLTTLSSKCEGLSKEESVELKKAQTAIDVAIRDLRSQLESSPSTPKVATPAPAKANGQLAHEPQR